MRDLTTRGNWQLILSEGRVVNYIRNTLPTRKPYYYNPINPFYTTPTKHTILVGVVSNKVQPHWYLGARVSQYLYVSPSNISSFISGVQVEDIKKAGLNKLTLMQFKNYNVVPYVLEIAIPHWLEDAYIEVWQYNGTVPSGEQPDFTELLDRIDELSRNLANISIPEQYNS